MTRYKPQINKASRGTLIVDRIRKLVMFYYFVQHRVTLCWKKIASFYSRRRSAARRVLDEDIMDAG